MTAATSSGDEDVDNRYVDIAPQLSLRKTFVRFWPMLRPLRFHLALIALLVAIGPGLITAGTFLFKELIDKVVVPGDLSPFPRLAGIFLGLGLAKAVVAFLDHYVSVWAGEKFILTLRTRLFAHLHRLTPDFLERRALGDVLARITGDVRQIEDLLLTTVTLALTHIFEIAFFSVALFVLDWRLTMAALLAAPAFLLIARTFGARLQVVSREKGRRFGGISSVAEESLSNAALVRAYDRGALEREKFAEQNRGGFRAQMAATRLEALFESMTELFEVIGVMAVIGMAIWELAQHRITVGGLLAFVAFLGQLYTPIQGLAQLSNEVFSASASAERVIELLDEEPSITEATDPCPLDRATGAVRFRNVSFGYPGLAEPVLNGVDFAAHPGGTVAIVGGSGAGKSTIAKLLLRFYDPASGSVELDGVDLRELRLEDLYRNVCTVLQETLVFDATVRENILWGKPDATEDEILAAATAADAHEFITELPDGYETRVGQRGRLLSGGQRQRLAIARAMIRDAPILLLDEPTTGLDADSSERVLVPLRRLMDGRTTIIISHNLLTVTDADQIVFLRDGGVAATGTHTTLMETNSEYARLYRANQHSPEAVEAAEVAKSPEVAESGEAESPEAAESGEAAAVAGPAKAEAVEPASLKAVDEAASAVAGAAQPKDVAAAEPDKPQDAEPDAPEVAGTASKEPAGAKPPEKKPAEKQPAGKEPAGKEPAGQEPAAVEPAMARLAAAHLADELAANRTAAPEPAAVRGRLDFERVGIAANNADGFGLAETSLHLEPGQCLVALGPPGSGSALVGLLLSRRRPETGTMRINGQLRTVGDPIDGGSSGTGPKIEFVRGAPWLRPKNGFDSAVDSTARQIPSPLRRPSPRPSPSPRPPADPTTPMVPVKRATPSPRAADLTAPLHPVKRAIPLQQPAADLTAPLVPVKRTNPAPPPADLTAPLVPVKRATPAAPGQEMAARPPAREPAAEGGAPAQGLSERERRDLDRLISSWSDADVLVLEEPTAGMDRRQRNEVVAVLSQLTCTTVIITADPVVAALGDHLVELAPLSPLRPRATASRTSRFRSGGVRT